MLITTALVRKDCAFEHPVTIVSNINSAACQKTEAGNTVASYILEVTKKKHVTYFNFMQFAAHRKRNHARLSVHMSICLHVITSETISMRCRVVSSISTNLNVTFFFLS